MMSPEVKGRQGPAEVRHRPETMARALREAETIARAMNRAVQRLDKVLHKQGTKMADLVAENERLHHQLEVQAEDLADYRLRAEPLLRPVSSEERRVLAEWLRSK